MITFLISFFLGLYIGTYYNCLPVIQFLSKFIKDHLPPDPEPTTKKRKKYDGDGDINMKSV